MSEPVLTPHFIVSFMFDSQAGYTPLDFALYHKHVDVAMMLIDSGAPVSVKGPVSLPFASIISPPIEHWSRVTSSLGLP